VWSATQAAARLADPAALDALLDAPALVVDLRAGPPPGPLPLARVPCPVIGLGASPGVVPDVTLLDGAADTQLLGDSVETAAEVLVQAAAAAPAAAALLAQVLRCTVDLPVEQALLVESAAYSLLLTGPEFRHWLETRTVPRPATDDGPAVVVRRDGALLELTLDRPSVRNAYDAAVRDGLAEGLAVALLDRSVGKVLLRGNGPSFCSGGDLRDFGTSTDLVRAHGIRTTRSPGALLHALADRTEVWVHGACVGAGVELPAFAGRVVARRDAFFRLPELAMGTIPGAGGTVSLPRRIGAGRTLLLALSGLTLGADDALRWGLVDDVVPAFEESGVTE
jgi:enoyl-CoA hydratase/carnithine racemase